ncbi:hypothetical protein AAG570_012128 [Ranatra chinensis]|uniref:Uncharacterized protein n=1 Tax=Ranatra chinensis TaxID=642074 RepID=A0ABD0YU94_9HEMI
MASKRRNVFSENKKQETTKIGLKKDCRLISVQTGAKVGHISDAGSARCELDAGPATHGSLHASNSLFNLHSILQNQSFQDLRTTFLTRASPNCRRYLSQKHLSNLRSWQEVILNYLGCEFVDPSLDLVSRDLNAVADDGD